MGGMDALRHSAVVRVTHWVNTAGVCALVVSGIAILIAHPRFYWGETGTVGTPSLFDLPVPFMLGHSGWGRYLHFLAAWVCVLNGVVYVITGIMVRRFRRELWPDALQRWSYIGVVFLLFPLIVLTGLAMSPAITSVTPGLVEVFGGQQSARTLHFFLADFLVLFFFGHVVMVSRAGFTQSVRGMITGNGV
jgi:thiosulfate reductase cytochrome b subunit